MVLRNIDTGEVHSCADQPGYLPIARGLELLSQASLMAGHNVINFDCRAIHKVYPSFKLRPDCDIYDTLVVSRVLWPELEPVDRQRFAHIASKYIGRHSLAAWGERLGVAKIKFQENSKKDPDVDNVWDVWSESMQTYCEGDTLVSLELFNYFQTQGLDPRCQELEHEFAKVMAMQEEFGFPFDERKAFALVNELKVKRNEINDQLQEVFPPIRTERWSSKTGKRLKDRVEVFNPASRHQISTRLRNKYPEIIFGTTEKGAPKVDDDVLEVLGEQYPEAKILADYQMYNKRLGQIAEGKEAWLKHCQKFGDGRIHGGVKTNACVSGRVSHVSPNMAQIPSVGHAYGAECRALFYAPDGWTLVGADASGLELRALGAWLAHFDGGEYAKLVSTEGFDIHTYNAKLFGIYDGNGDITKAARDLSKRLIYCVPVEGTTVLTKKGWKTYEQLELGELVMTYNQEKNIKEWKPILHIVEAYEDDVWEMSHSHSYKVKATADHRWYVRKRTQAKHVQCGWKTGARYMVPKVETTAEINQESNIIVNAPLVEEDCEGITLDWSWPKYGTDWTEKVLQMSSKQRRAWLSGFMLADGFNRIKENQKPGWSITQLKNEHYEAALTAAYLEFDGHLHVTQGLQPNGKTRMQITIANKGHVTGQKLQKTYVGRKKVFCISTENESFVMRQGECITITGNCVLYGGGSKKTGSIISPNSPEGKQYEVGKATIETFYRNLPAIKALKNKIEERVDQRGYLLGIDGRRLQIRSKHSALNQLLQSTGALLMKKATCILYNDLQKQGLKHFEDWGFCVFCHDEWQILTLLGNENIVANSAVKAIEKAGEYFRLMCPFTGEYRIGKNWAATH